MIPLITKIGSIALKLGRGALKATAPGISAIVENIRNRKGVKVEVTTDAGERVTGTARPHDPWSIAGGYIMAGVMIYLVVSGKLPLEKARQLVEMVMGLL